MLASFPASLVDTLLCGLAPLFLLGAAGDITAARQAAAAMLQDSCPESEEELRLAAQVIAFGLHALQALGQAMDRDLSLTRILRLRGSAVSLSRESGKAQRRLDQIRKARQAATSSKARTQVHPATPPPTPPAHPRQAPANSQPAHHQPPDAAQADAPQPHASQSHAPQPHAPQPHAPQPLASQSHASHPDAAKPDAPKIATLAKSTGLTWTQAYEQQQREKRLAASLRRAEARVAAINVAPNQAARVEAPPSAAIGPA